MSFSTNVFIFFFLPITVLFYRMFDKKYKTMFLVLASLLFYAWNDTTNLKIVIMMLVVNYMLLLLNKKFSKQWLLAIAIIANILILVQYKYIDYIISMVQRVFSMELPSFNLIAPIGISFIVFHAISLQVDTYRDKNLYTHHVFAYSNYLLFFPKILQGPIVKYKDFQKQEESLNFSFDFFITGVERFIIGLAKKVVIADVLVSTVNNGLGYWSSYGIDQPSYWIIAICYVFVIYFDFSGYSDMAIGISRMLGYNIQENFNYPYISTSITEFWRRWHISLGDWFKEYVYIPLGGNRRGNVYFNLAIVFVLTGIWHGAGILYLCWGCLHGTMILLERFLLKKEVLKKVPSIVGWIYTTIIVSFGWLIFLLPDRSELLSFLKGMLGSVSSDGIPFTYEYMMSNKLLFTILLALIGSYVFALPSLRNKVERLNKESKIFNIAKYLCLLGLLIYSLISVINGTYSPFIYFQY